MPMPHAPLRIARIIDRLNVGGPAKHVVWLSDGLARLGHETVLLTGTIAPGEGDMRWFADAAGVEPIVIEHMGRAIGPRDLVAVVRVLRHLHRLRPDIVHTHKAKAGTIGRVAAVLYRWLTPSALWLRPRPCRVVHTYHGHIFHSYYGRLATWCCIAVERLLCRLATDVVITLSESQRRDITERFRIAPAAKVRVVPLGIDLEEIGASPAGLRAKLGLSSDGMLVGTVGRLCEVKDQGMLLEAAALLAGTEPPTRFVVVGDGHLRPQLEAYARRLEVTDRITFLGFRDDVLRLYPDLDVVALTSHNEGTPVTLLEAMACGRPVASTEVGGVADIMGGRRAAGDGFTVWGHGVTVPDRDPAAFARALRFLLERPALRQEMGGRARAFVTTRMSTARLVSDVEKLYWQLVRHGADVVGEGVEDEGSDHRRRRVHRLASG